MRHLILAVGLLVPIMAAQANSGVNGYTLLQKCSPQPGLWCLGYLEAIADTMDEQHTACFMDGTPTTGDLADTMVEYLHQNPEDRQVYAPHLVESVFAWKFPCPEPSPR